LPVISEALESKHPEQMKKVNCKDLNANSKLTHALTVARKKG